MTGRTAAGEDGFTLTELLVTIAILGIIGAALTGAVILGFRTTDATGARVARSSAIQALTAYFTEDVQRAETVSSTTTGEPAECVTGDPGRFVRLSWTDGGATRTAVYALDPPTGTAHDLVRWSCLGAGPATPRVLGHFVHAEGAPLPVSATCDGNPCPDTPGTPAAVTLRIHTDPSKGAAAPIELTVRRRTS